MASRIYAYYLKAGEIGGVQARTKLSVLTKISSVQASSIQDSVENIRIFEDAMKQIVKEFANGPSVMNTMPLSVTTPVMADGDCSDYLRKHMRVLSDLTTQGFLNMGDFTATAKKITEAITYAINVERCGIWLYDENKTNIRCEDIYIRRDNEHDKGDQLYAKEFPRYFASMKAEKTVAANDAHEDPRTSEFSDNYLSRLGITSMLDVPIWVEGKMVGVICSEHIGPARKWTVDEENFVGMLANLVAVALETQKKQLVLV